ncbi:hypothetical protein [Synechococcus sp. 1G10]|uniref:hypothetical protein n=1 Tax=Synechococcus sp. 1G10 TaxID=2025605 RepID=UPI001E4DF3B8|nr:hypothetical protein [Synechococcus sp. 1G10]
MKKTLKGSAKPPELVPTSMPAQRPLGPPLNRLSAQMEHGSFTDQATWLKISRVEALRSRLQHLRERLQSQIQSLPLGNEGWLNTERELNAAEAAMSELGDWRLG